MKRKTTIFLLLLPFLLITGIVLVSVWNVLVQSLGYIPAFGLTKPTLSYYAQVFSRTDFLSAVWVSMKISLWSTVFAVALGVLLAMALSTLFTLVPLLKQVSAGISIVICTVAAAAVCAVLFPIPEEEEA